MRLFTKYFLFGMLVFGLALSVSGYFLLRYSMESSMAREADFALKQYQYDKFTVQSALLSFADISLAVDVADTVAGDAALPDTMQFFTVSKNWLWEQGDRSYSSLFSILAEEISSPVAFYWEDGTAVYSEIEGLEVAFLESLREDAHVYQFRETPGGGSVLVGGILNFDGFITENSTWSVTENGQETWGAEDVAEVQMEDGEADKDAAGKAGGAGAAETVGDADAAGRGGDTNATADTAGDAVAATETIGGAAEGTFRTTEKDTITEADAGIIAVLPGQPLGGARKIRFVTQWDITKTVQQQETMRQYFIRCYVAAMAAGMLLMGGLSALLTGPLKRMSRAAGRMAEGCYEERLSIHGKDEIGELAGSFNQMAAAVEEKIDELSRAAREKEDFVANFAHELKTPLTSIIGYADTIYQKELPREEIRRASWHIWNEGMRLEALSFKLMELIVLGRQDFPLVEMPADELLRDVAEGLAPLLEEHGVTLELEAGEAYIKVDYDLFKTLLINLMDNSVKAGSSRVTLWGGMREGRYEITVRDNGCGMEEEDLSRIKEAFYMVDKARSRKQHGAGLGLALADRIARIHGSDLKFESRKGEGTVVAFWVECAL